MSVTNYVWLCVVAALYGAILAVSYAGRCMYPVQLDEFGADVLWWCIAIPTAFYVAPSVHLSGRLLQARASIRRALIEALSVAALVAACLIPRLSPIWDSYGVVASYDADNGELFTFLFCVHPGIPGRSGFLQAVMLLLDAVLATSLCLRYRVREAPWVSVAIALIWCLVLIPVGNLVLLLAIGHAHFALRALLPFDPRLSTYYCWSFLVVAARVVIPCVLLLPTLRRSSYSAAAEREPT